MTRALLLASALLCAACSPKPTPTDGGSPACESFATVHEQLLNAPTTATVVKKIAAVPDGGFP